ncbi:hypothetical protein [Bradyrhizobium sp. BRP23]|uniref:hypothetical protein n=1 Tax=Bradyrhizobium sp. BRP23 TaxID=2793820 RepID=UPI001CD3CE1B|nr:hypothetical protein [Bradyrhizobium sp. BRP23]MCA1419511.1 hypothetical protein [Bradyrhizobium sp. BRP23]
MKRLKLGAANDKAATLVSDDGVITIACDDASTVARVIAIAVNHHPALVAALTPFRSGEMGDLLVDLIDQREPNSETAQARLIQLVAMIDVILDSVEGMERHDLDA